MARLSKRGQVTIPKAAREAIGLLPGARVELEVRQGAILIRKASIRPAIERWAGRLRPGGIGPTTDLIMEDLRGGAFND